VGGGVDGHHVTTAVGAVAVALSPHALSTSASPAPASNAVAPDRVMARVFLQELNAH
jgi:hypothetical protein